MGKIINKLRRISTVMNLANNFKRVSNDFFKNMTATGIQDLRGETLTPENFVLYLPAKNLPLSFGISDINSLEKILLTKIGEPVDTMRIRIKDGSANISKSLYFLVNPASMQIDLEKSYSDYITREGPKSEYWGNKPINISFDGSSGGFYGVDTSGTGYGIEGFMTTLSFKNIMSLVTFYKNNGFVYGNLISVGGSRGFNHGKDKRDKDVERVDLVELTYKDTVYLGSFSSMSLTYSSSSPNRMTYSFTFIAYRQIVVDYNGF